MEKIRENPLVSVCIPVYNGAKVIADTIQSLLAQTYENIEFIVVDNDSTDNSLEIVRALAGNRMKIIKNETNIGAAANWNKCIEVSQGEFIAIYHSDDVYDSTIVEKSVDAFLYNENIGAVFTEAYKVDAKLNILAELSLAKDLQGKASSNLVEVLSSFLRNRTNPFICPSCMVRKRIYEQIGNYNKVDFQYAFDLDMYMRILEVANVVFIEEKLVNYRVSKSQGSFKYKVEQTEPGEMFVILDRYVNADFIKKSKIKYKYLQQYQCMKDTEKYRRAVNLLRMGHPGRAKELLFASITLCRLKFSFRRFSIFRGMVYTLLFIIAFYLGLGKSAAYMAYKIDKRKFDRS